MRSEQTDANRAEIEALAKECRRLRRALRLALDGDREAAVDVLDRPKPTDHPATTPRGPTLDADAPDLDADEDSD